MYDIMEFDTLEFDELLSDAHNPVKMGFKCTMQNTIVPTIREDELADNDDTTQFNKQKWVNDCESGFKNSINLKDVEDIEKYFDNLMCNDIDEASVNDIVNRITDIQKVLLKLLVV